MLEVLRRVYLTIRHWYASDDETRAALMTTLVSTLHERRVLRVKEVGRDRDRQRGLPYLTRAYLIAFRERWVRIVFGVLAAIHAPFNVPLSVLFLVLGYAIGEVTAFIHCFSQDDPDQLHDHPWRWWFRIILTGGYFEETFDGKRFIRPGIGSFEFRLGARFHRVSLPPRAVNQYRTWTLFVHGPRRYSWGFLYTGEDGLVRRTDESKKRTSE